MGRSDQRADARPLREHLPPPERRLHRVADGGAFAPQSQKTIHWESYDFYAYLNQWWITAGVRLSRSDFVHRATSYVLKHWHNEAIHAGCLQAPLGSGRHENCIFTSAHLGFTLLHTGAPAEAERIGRTIVAMVAKQPPRRAQVL